MADAKITRGARYHIAEPEILVGREESSEAFELADAEEAMQLITKLAAGGKVGLLMDISKLRTMSREARAFFQRPEHTKVLHAVALIINSPFSRAIGNIFLGLNRTAMPTRLFNDEKLALEWLRTFVAGRAASSGASSR